MLCIRNFVFQEQGESSKKGKTKKKKDPNAPKRAMSAYMLWLAEARQQIKEENPGISITDLTKRAGEKWKTLSDKSVSMNILVDDVTVN